MADQTPGSTGHRERLRARLLDGGADSLQDYELVEYLLGLSIRRQDTKQLAKNLLKEFGGLGGLLSADWRSIKKRSGLSETTVAALKIAQVTAVRLAKAQMNGRHVVGSWESLIDYLRIDMGHHRVERVRVLYLNSRNIVVWDEAASEGSIDEAAIYVREIIQRALDHGATALIIVHNHPSGDPSPSAQDIRITKDLIEACRPLRINVHDHVIVGANGATSLKAMGLI